MSHSCLVVIRCCGGPRQDFSSEDQPSLKEHEGIDRDRYTLGVSRDLFELEAECAINSRVLAAAHGALHTYLI